MGERISDPDVILARLARMEEETSRFVKLIELLEATAEKFKSFEAHYQMICDQLATIKRDGQAINSDQETAIRHANETSENLRGLGDDVDEGLKRLHRTLDEFEQSAEARATSALGELRNNLSELHNSFESKQFSKLNNVIQTYDLMERKVKNYETRVEASETSLEESRNSLTKGIESLADDLKRLRESSAILKGDTEAKVAETKSSSEVNYAALRFDMTSQFKESDAEFKKVYAGLKQFLTFVTILSVVALGLAGYLFWQSL